MVETDTKICHKMRTKTPTNSPSLEYSYTITPQTQVRCSSEGTETVAHAPKSWTLQVCQSGLGGSRNHSIWSVGQVIVFSCAERYKRLHSDTSAWINSLQHFGKTKKENSASSIRWSCHSEHTLGNPRNFLGKSGRYKLVLSVNDKKRHSCLVYFASHFKYLILGKGN